MGSLTDVTKRGGSGGGGGGSSSAQWEPPPQGERSKGAKGEKGDKQGKNGPRFDSQGNFVANHGGTPLCFAYQTGECTEVTMVNNVPRCSCDTSRAHQCARCLGSHPAKPKDGTACVVPPPQKTIRRDSWGKGRGKGGKKD